MKVCLWRPGGIFEKVTGDPVWFYRTWIHASQSLKVKCHIPTWESFLRSRHPNGVGYRVRQLLSLIRAWPTPSRKHLRDGVYITVLTSGGHAWHSVWESVWDFFRPKRERQNGMGTGHYRSVFSPEGSGVSGLRSGASHEGWRER